MSDSGRSLDKSKYYQPAYHAEHRQDGWITIELPPKNAGLIADFKRQGGCVLVATIAVILIILAVVNLPAFMSLLVR